MKTIDLSKEVADILSKEIQAEMDKHIIDTLTNLFGTIKECSRPCRFIDHPIYNKRLGLIKNEYMGSYEILVKKHKQSVRTQVNKEDITCELTPKELKKITEIYFDELL